MDSTVKYRLWYVWMVSLVAALGGLLFGYDWVVIGGAKLFYEKFFDLGSEWLQGWAMSCALVGCLFGALGSGALSDRFGRKRLLIVAALLFAVSSIGTGMASHFYVFIAWRILRRRGHRPGIEPFAHVHRRNRSRPDAGQAGGDQPVHHRHRHSPGAVRQLADRRAGAAPQHRRADSGVLERPDGLAVDVRGDGDSLAVVPGGNVLRPGEPALARQERQLRPRRAILGKVGGGGYAADALAEIRATLAQGTPRVDFKDLVDRRVLPILLLGVILAVFQQWCGINVFFMYSGDVLGLAGYQITDILWNIVITGAVNVVFTVVAMATVNRVGRRKLMLFGSVGLAVIYVLLGACYYAMGHGQHIPGPVVLGLILLAIGCYAMTLAPVVWVVIAEIFPNRIRGTAMSLVIAALWIACFVVVDGFPILYKRIGLAFTFWMFAGICILGFVYLFFRLPETKGKSLEELEHQLVK